MGTKSACPEAALSPEGFIVSTKLLATYLKDHHAGSEAAVSIVEHLAESHPDSEAARIAPRLKAEFEGERQQLAMLLKRLDDSTSAPRRVVGWMSEKALELKLWADDRSDGALHLLEAVEMLGLGVHGKIGLWKALDANRTAEPVLAMLQYEPLIRQGEAQAALIECARLEAARAVAASGE
jgi:hypothetical protein